MQFITSLKNWVTKKLSFPWYTKNSGLFHIWIENPLRTWWEAREYFKRPKISFRVHKVTRTTGYPYATYRWIGKILDIRLTDVQWKDKWDSPRHERNPLVWICFFRCIALTVRFDIWGKDEFGEKESYDMVYWEYLLDYLKYKNKKSLLGYGGWIQTSRLYKIWIPGKTEEEDSLKPMDVPLQTVSVCLNKKGIKQLKKELGI